MRKQKPYPKVREFTELCLKEGIFSPSIMAQKYNEKYELTEKKNKDGKTLERTDNAFTMVLRRMGISADKRLEMKYENGKETQVKDIEEYKQVKNYKTRATAQQLTQTTIEDSIENLRKLWVMMGKTNPETWTEADLWNCMEKNIGKNKNGKWKKPSVVMFLLGSFNRMFMGVLPKGSFNGLKGEVGHKKDFWEFGEFIEFIEKQENTFDMSREGWQCLFTQQVTRGCREGTNGETGIVSARWEQINYTTRRTEQIDKGEKGRSQRKWNEIPCDLFPWIHAWDYLINYHKQLFGYEPSNEKHGNGRMFSITYAKYLKQFHIIRKKCSGRLSDENDKRRPHVLRMTHAQWNKRIGISLENTCGDTSVNPSVGRYGVGWTDLSILLRYYLTKEPYEYAEQDEKIAKRLFEIEHEIEGLGEAPFFAWSKNSNLESTRF